MDEEEFVTYDIVIAAEYPLKWKILDWILRPSGHCWKGWPGNPFISRMNESSEFVYRVNVSNSKKRRRIFVCEHCKQKWMRGFLVENCEVGQAMNS